MKKLRLLALSLVLIAGTAVSAFAIDFTAYPDSFKQGNLAINAGVGLGSALYGNTVIPPLSATVDYALPIAKLPFSVGGLVGFTSSEYKYDYASWGSYKYNYSIIALGARLGYHFNLDVKNLDTYVGTMLGYYIVSASYSGTGIYSSSGGSAGASTFAWGGYAGARYFFTKNIGAFAELGAGFTYVTGGLSFKL
jgi:hypothetical protein